MTTTAAPSPRPMSLPALWNMNVGFIGIQFGWGLQMANMSAIYEYLGAKESDIPILWLAAPLTGLLVQPVIGYYSDRTWTRLGRRRPYFLVGAILASLALLAMPNASALWMAAGLLWILDASVNVSMEPFRAFVGDLLPPQQRKIGFAMQSLMIGLGAVSSSYLPWLLTKLGVVHAGAGVQGVIPESVRISFYVGAVVYLCAVLYTIVTTKEHPPAESEPPGAGGPLSVFKGIVQGIREMPPTMKRLAPVQFFTWLGLFCLWLYFTPAVARTFFKAAPGTADYTHGVEVAGTLLGNYNLVAFFAAFGLVELGRRGVSAKTLHRIGLLSAGAGLATVGLWSDVSLINISMIGVGIGWATILSMPYALLSNSLPPERMGFYMGVFNFFIVIPQILAATVLGPVVSAFFDGQPMKLVYAGGGSLLLAALCLNLVPEKEA